MVFHSRKKCHRTAMYSNLTTANNLIWNLLVLSFQAVQLYMSAKFPPRGGGISLAGPRTNCYEPLFVSVSLLNHVICKSWRGAISKKTIGDEFSWNSQQPPAPKPLKNPERTMFSQLVKRSPCMVALQNSAYWSASPVKSRSHDYLRTHKGC